MLVITDRMHVRGTDCQENYQFSAISVKSSNRVKIIFKELASIEILLERTSYNTIRSRTHQSDALVASFFSFLFFFLFLPSRLQIAIRLTKKVRWTLLVLSYRL